MMRRSIILPALAFFTAAPTVALADVSLEVMQGTILVETKAGLMEADSITFLESGDRVFLKANSSAILSFDEGCFINLRSPGQYVIPDMSNCEAGQTRILSSNFEITPANGLPTPPPPPAFYGAAPASSFTPVAVGIGFVTTAAAVATYATIINPPEETVVPVSVP
jgi:hypothetical protein